MRSPRRIIVVRTPIAKVSEDDPWFAEYETYARSLCGPQRIEWHRREELQPNAGREFTAWIDPDRFFVKRRPGPRLS